MTTEQYSAYLGVMDLVHKAKRKPEAYVWFTFTRVGDRISLSWPVQPYIDGPRRYGPNPRWYKGVRDAYLRLKKNQTIHHVKVVGPVPTMRSPYFRGDSYYFEEMQKK
jgi:hypothetical protein